MLVVVEPGRGSLDCAARIFRMAEDIGLEDLRVVANKIASPEDEKFVREGLPGRKILASIPYSDAIRRADRAGASVLEGVGADASMRFEEILRAFEAGGAP
jgi:CO dehydrogenase maturation factor